MTFGDIRLTSEALPNEPKDPVGCANWLPSPKNAEFSLYVRTYWPEDAITRGQWTIVPLRVPPQ